MNKKWLYLLLLVVLVFVGFYLYRKYRVAPAINFNALSLSDLENNPVTFDQFKGKKTVVSFGASWCPNCLEELQELNAVKAAELPDVQVIVISDEPLEKVRAFAERTGYPFTFLKMNQSFPAIGVNSIPVSYMLNSRQQVMKEVSGYINWKDPSTCEHLKTVMED